MPEPSKVFISYARRDHGFVERLSSDLRFNGIDTWRDVEQIRPGSSWEDELIDGLKSATTLLYVVSRNSIGSSWIRAEISAFLTRAKETEAIGTLVPVIVGEISDEEIPEEIRQIQWIDFRYDYQDALKILVRYLKPFGSSEAPIPPKDATTKGYVFISYAENDQDFVKELREFLKGYNYNYWDYSESNRNYHTKLWKELEGIIKDAAATLSILSAHWKESQWTDREYFFSEEVGVPVFLLKAKPVGPILAVSGRTYIDFTTSRQKGFEKLQKELQRKGL
jgi:hypothetical protein